jgi:uncharacterized protein YjbI with pentapeptide repeats
MPGTLGVRRTDASSLTQEDLREADLVGANLSNAQFVMANLEGAKLMQASLYGADLDEALLSGADLRGAVLSEADLRKATLYMADLSGADLRGAVLSGADLSEANLSGTDLPRADLRWAFLIGANLRGANLRGAVLSGAVLNGANLNEANLEAANLSGAHLAASLVNTNLTSADLTGCHIYGVSAWNLKLEKAKQQNLVITPSNEPEITVDNVEIAQFVYLMLHNEKIRDVIDTITSKAVLILGRFTEERKPVLEALREELRQRKYLPILFDFEKPRSRNTDETITLLARMARFVVADISDAKSVLQELRAIVPDLPSVRCNQLSLRCRRSPVCSTSTGTFGRS